MVDKAARFDGSDARKQLLARIEAAEDPELVILDQLIEQLEHANPILGQMLRACAIPRRIDAKIIGVLREQTEDQEENYRLLNGLQGYSFVVARTDGTYVYHDTVRDRLIKAWRTPGSSEQFQTYNRRLIKYYESEWAKAGEVAHDFYLVAELLRGGNIIRYMQLENLLEKGATVLIIEALYHATLLSADDAFDLFERYFYIYEKIGRREVCRTLLSALRDNVERVEPNKSDRDLLPWLDYFEARIYQGSGHYKEAEERLLRLRGKVDGDITLKLWILGNIGDLRRIQFRLPEARELYEEVARISEEKSVDLYNLCITYGNIGNIDYTLGALDKAETNYRRALQSAQENDNHDWIVSSRLSLSKVLQVRGAISEAVDSAFRALHQARTDYELRSEWRIANVVSQRFMELAAGKFPQLLDTAYEECRALIGQTTLDIMRETELSYLECLRSGGQLRRASKLLEGLESKSDPQDEACVTNEQNFIAADIRADQGLPLQAIRVYDRILATLRDTLDSWDWARALLARGIQKSVLASSEEAESDLQDAERRWRELAHDPLAAFTRVCLANTLRQRGRYDEAQAMLDGAREPLERETPSVRADPSDWYEAQAKLCFDLGRFEDAKTNFERALKIAILLDNLSFAAHTAADFSLLAATVSDWENASQLAAQASELWARLREMDSYRPSEKAAKADDLNRRGLEHLMDPRSGRHARITEAAELFQAAAGSVPDNPNPWYYLNLSYATFELGDWYASADAFEKALRFFPAWLRCGALNDRLAEIRTEQGKAMFQSGDYAKAIDFYQRALELTPNDAELHLSIASAWENRRTVGKRDEELEHAITHLRQAVALSPDDPGYTKKLSQLLKIHRFGEVSERPPISTPIRVEIGDALVPKVDPRQDGGMFLYKLIPAMQDRIRQAFGVNVPGVRFRVNTTLAANAYVIMIEDIPVSSGDIPINHFFCVSLSPSPGSQAAASLMADPITGEKGLWLEPDAIPRLADGRAPARNDAEMLIRNIEAVLRINLDHFLGVQEVEWLLATWSQDDSVAALIKEALPDGVYHLGFARLLRALVREQVPITAAREILSTIQGISLAPGDIAGALRAVRLQLKRLLPGNAAGLSRIELPPELEHGLEGSLYYRTGSCKSAPQAIHDTVVYIEKLLPSNSISCVLIVSNAALRPLVQRMVKFSSSRLWVLARDELLSSADAS